MLVKDIRTKISTKEFAHCTDAILSLVLDRPRTEIMMMILYQKKMLNIVRI